MESVVNVFGSVPVLEESSGVLHDGAGRGDKKITVLESVQHGPCGCFPEESLDIREVFALETFALTLAYEFLKDLAALHHFTSTEQRPHSPEFSWESRRSFVESERFPLRWPMVRKRGPSSSSHAGEIKTGEMPAPSVTDFPYVEQFLPRGRAGGPGEYPAHRKDGPEAEA